MIGDFPRTLGVPGDDVPRFPEAPVLELVPDNAIDLSHEATPASDDLRNALQILAPTNDSLIGDAVKVLILSALKKIELEAAQRCPQMSVVA